MKGGVRRRIAFATFVVCGVAAAMLLLSAARRRTTSLAAGADDDTTTSISSSSSTVTAGTNRGGRSSFRRTDEIHRGWKACRLRRDDPAADAAAAARDGCATGDADTILLDVRSLPTTALAVLLDNGRIIEATNNASSSSFSAEDMYYSDRLSRLPDISTVGRQFYTLLYEYRIPPLNGDDDRAARTAGCCNSNRRRRTLRLSGINYRANAFLDGRPLDELNDFDQTKSVDGMFRRRYYDVTPGGRLNLLVEPPLHPGTPSPAGGTQHQGGEDHQLAKDGPTAQYLLGWDFASSMPDRSTGFYGTTVLETLNGQLAILDPAVYTRSLMSSSNTNAGEDNDDVVVLTFVARIECVGSESFWCNDDNDEREPSFALTIESDWGETWTVTGNTSGSNTASHNNNNTYTDVELTVSVSDADKKIRLWWPHGVGAPVEEAQLHSFTFSVARTVNNFEQRQQCDVSDRVTVNVGIRTVDTYLDETVQGQVFKVNGERVYLVGGNWIGTDQALRYSADEARYCRELELHKAAGLNLVRVWGGGTAERDQFYDCADRLGILVFQEFWMTGDNNGRWAGNYSWPLDHRTYLVNVADTIRRLRRHPSLLFYGGCNECLAPRGNRWAPNPPATIDQGIRSMLKQFDDPNRFYISSSMGGPNHADTFRYPGAWVNRSYSLAFSDGPYSMQLPATYFERNPGLEYKNRSIGFQPEVGPYAASPTYEGLLRFMSEKDVESGFPRRNGTTDNAIWRHHKFIPWTTGSYDHVYAYFGETHLVGASDWAAAAQLASYMQNLYLFAGFISHIFEYTSAVLLWKTQSPWPVLRGFLYDWWLETTGAFLGVKAVLGGSVSAVFDTLTWQLRLVNREITAIDCVGRAVGAQYEWVDLQGRLVASGRKVVTNTTVAPMSSVVLGDVDEESMMIFPSNCSSVCFLRLKPELPGERNYPSTWMWLTDPTLGNESDFSSLGEARLRQAGQASLSVLKCAFSTTREGSTAVATTSMLVQITVPSSSPEILFFPTLSVYVMRETGSIDDGNGEPLLPLRDSGDTEIVILPGQSQLRRISSSVSAEIDTDEGGIIHQQQARHRQLEVKLTSWNAPTVRQTVLCRAGSSSNDNDGSDASSSSS